MRRPALRPNPQTLFIIVAFVLLLLLYSSGLFSTAENQTLNKSTPTPIEINNVGDHSRGIQIREGFKSPQTGHCPNFRSLAPNAEWMLLYEGQSSASNWIYSILRGHADFSLDIQNNPVDNSIYQLEEVMYRFNKIYHFNNPIAVKSFGVITKLGGLGFTHRFFPDILKFLGNRCVKVIAMMRLNIVKEAVAQIQKCGSSGSFSARLEDSTCGEATNITERDLKQVLKYVVSNHSVLCQFIQTAGHTIPIMIVTYEQLAHHPIPTLKSMLEYMDVKHVESELLRLYNEAEFVQEVPNHNLKDFVKNFNLLVRNYDNSDLRNYFYKDPLYTPLNIDQHCSLISQMVKEWWPNGIPDPTEGKRRKFIDPREINAEEDPHEIAMRLLRQVIPSI